MAGEGWAVAIGAGAGFDWGAVDAAGGRGRLVLGPEVAGGAWAGAGLERPPPRGCCR